MTDFELPITTAQDLPGAEIRENLGIAFGLVVRSMGFAKNFSAGFKSLRRGEVTEYTDLLEDARRHAIDRMVANAKLLGANGIVAMRFDSSEMGNQLTEVVAYGTAVVIDACRRLSRSASRRCSAATTRRTGWTPTSSTAASTSRSRAHPRRPRRPPAAGARGAAEAPLGPPSRRVRRGRSRAGCRPRSASSTRAPSA